MEDWAMLRISSLAQPSGYTEPILHGWRLKVKIGKGLARLHPIQSRLLRSNSRTRA